MWRYEKALRVATGSVVGAAACIRCVSTSIEAWEQRRGTGVSIVERGKKENRGSSTEGREGGALRSSTRVKQIAFAAAAPELESVRVRERRGAEKGGMLMLLYSETYARLFAEKFCFVINSLS